MSDFKGQTPGATGAASSGNGGDPGAIVNYSISASEAQQALTLWLNFLPEDAREKASKFLTSKVIADSLALSGFSLPPEIEKRLFNLKTVSSSTILQTEYPPLPELVPGYLMAGLSFLIGKPKVGKSWLAMQLALSVLTGGKIFGQDVAKGRTLYFALEDSERRLQKRMKSQHWPAEHGVDFVLYDEFQARIGALNNAESSKLLLKFIQRLDYKLVIVDTFSRAIKGDQLNAEEMTAALGSLQQYALGAGIAVLIIDHMPKNANPNEYDAISHVYGSVAKAGIADSSWAIYKERGRYGGAVLAITGREIEEIALRLVFDKQGYFWHSEGNAEDMRISAKREEVLLILNEIGPAKAQIIARAMQADLSLTCKRLNDLIEAGLIEKDKAGVYKVI